MAEGSEGFEHTKSFSKDKNFLPMVKSELYNYVKSRDANIKFLKRSLKKHQEKLETDIKYKDKDEVPEDKLGLYERFIHQKTLYGQDELPITITAEKTIDAFQGCAEVYKEFSNLKTEIIDDILRDVIKNYVRKNLLEEAKEEIEELAYEKVKEKDIYKRFEEVVKADYFIKNPNMLSIVMGVIGNLTKMGILEESERSSIEVLIKSRKALKNASKKTSKKNKEDIKENPEEGES